MLQLSQVSEGSRGSWPVRAKAWLNERIPISRFSSSDVDMASVRSIIEDDDRVIEIDTLGVPQRLVVSLTIYSNSGARFFGSAWVAAPRVVLTCGHCVFDEQLGGFASKIEIVPGRSGEKRPFGTFESTSFEAHPLWKSMGDRSLDIGCIFLKETLGDRLGHFAIGQISSTGSIEGEQLRCAGYPIFDGKHSLQLSGGGTAKSVVGTRLYHDIDTENGTSGGPIWLAEGNGSPPTVVAVHSYEKQAVPGQPGELANSATLISESTFQMIKAWIDSAN